MDILQQTLKPYNSFIKGGAIVSTASILGFYLLARSQTSNVFSDFQDSVFLLSFRKELKKIEKNSKWTIVDVFLNTVKNHPDSPAILFLDKNQKRTYTFKQVDQESNKVANWAVEEGIKAGDVIGLVMDNRPEFIITWLGLAKAGCTIALINTNLLGDPLIYSMDISKAQRFIIGVEHSEKAQLGMDRLPGKKWFISGGSLPGAPNIEPLLRNPAPVDPAVRASCGPNTDLLYIYTSGTTGNPKAGVIKNIRFYMAGMVFSRSFKITPNDRIYCTLPLYHSAGGMLGVGMSWHGGACMVLRRKFSSTKFWQDIQENDCTVFQYIGELCRYLLNQPPTPYDKSKIRVAIGNGLRPDIWRKFQDRFNIQQIGEFYAATEGNTSVINTKNKEGAVGYVPPLITKLYPLTIIKLDEDNETPLRQKNGLCIPCKNGEKGELLGLIDNSDPTRKFDGYTSKEATSKKVIRDVLKKGDQYFRSGDLLKRDDGGFYYFVDRIGDTFRWKGENVATSEVEHIIAKVAGVNIVNVYGVSVPDRDGRAGMAALIVDDKFTFEELYDRVTKELPSYARPVFVRIMSGMDTTSTHKLQKVEARNQGFDITKIQDPIYFRDDALQKYVKIDAELYNNIITGKLASKL